MFSNIQNIEINNYQGIVRCRTLCDKVEFFQAFAHPARIKILELLREGELSVNALQARLEMEPSGVSQQLAILRGRHIVESRKKGTSVYYRVRDPQVFDLLDVANFQQ